MSQSLPLLGLPVAEAHQRMVAEALHDGVDVNLLQIGHPYVRGDGRVGLLVSVADEAFNDPNMKWYGSVDFSLRRMPLEEFFQGIELKIKLPATAEGGLNVTTDDVVDKLSEIFKIRFDPVDYFSDAIVSAGSADYMLRATVVSPRWTGQVLVQIYPDL